MHRVKRQSANIIGCEKVAQEYACTSGYAKGQIEEALMCRNESAARLMAQGCAKNERGEFCSSVIRIVSQSVWSSVVTNCDSSSISCSEECRNSLESLKNTLGCCLNYSLYDRNEISPNIDIRNYIPYSLWSKCTVAIPSACTNGLEVPQSPSNAQVCTPEQFSRRITEYRCRSSNGQPLVDRVLGDNRCADYTYAQYLVDGCSINADDQYCFVVLDTNTIFGRSESPFRSLTTNCTFDVGYANCISSCRSSIVDAMAVYGCCLELTNRTTAGFLGHRSLSYAVWNSCGIQPPQNRCASTLTINYNIIAGTGHAAHLKVIGWMISTVAVLAMIFNNNNYC